MLGSNRDKPAALILLKVLTTSFGAAFAAAAIFNCLLVYGMACAERLSSRCRFSFCSLRLCSLKRAVALTLRRAGLEREYANSTQR